MKGRGALKLDSRFVCAAVVELYLRAGDHLTGFLRVQAELHASPVWEGDGKVRGVDEKDGERGEWGQNRVEERDTKDVQKKENKVPKEEQCNEEKKGGS